MTSNHSHLTEDERQQAADDSLAPEQRANVAAHLGLCAECAEDVARLAALMKHVREAPAPDAPLDDLWPSIRARIEGSKVIPLGHHVAATRVREHRRLVWLAPLGIAAALLIGFFGVRNRQVVGERTLVSEPDTGASLVTVVDSAHAYEREAQILLDKLELERAMLRPEAREALDRDLRVVDVAIAELKEAVAHDPANPALRQLLAASYRQKVDLLKRAGNAG
jgi:anti-sigma factor RsiW